jgi:hypothetical protein
MACVPGQSIACAGPGGCISSQVCDDAGTGYGACLCASDGGSPLLCVPGQSIACAGPYGCPSFQVCNASGSAYGPCDCPDAATLYGADAEPDGYAPLPPPVGAQGYNAIWSAGAHTVFLPLFSAPSCQVVPPYGEYYGAVFQPSGVGPTGTFPYCNVYGGGPMPCYVVELQVMSGGIDDESLPGGTYNLSAFNADGIATGQMNTTEGIVPLVVKNCP